MPALGYTNATWLCFVPRGSLGTSGVRCPTKDRGLSYYFTSPLSWQFITLYKRERALASLYSSNDGVSGTTYLSFSNKALNDVILNIFTPCAVSGSCLAQSPATNMGLK